MDSLKKLAAMLDESQKAQAHSCTMMAARMAVIGAKASFPSSTIPNRLWAISKVGRRWSLDLIDMDTGRVTKRFGSQRTYSEAAYYAARYDAEGATPQARARRAGD